MKIRMLLFLLMVTLLSSSCQKPEETHTANTKELEELLIFYEDGTENLLTDFKLQYPEYDILMRKTNGEAAIEREKLYYGEPDVILQYYNLNSEEKRALEAKYGYDLSGFIQEDVSIEDGKYFPDTFSVCQQGDEILAVPLGISLNMMVLREENWIGSAFAELEDGYTGKDLLDAIEFEIDHEIENELFINQDSVGISFQMLQLLGGINEKDGVISIDEDLYAQLYNIWYKGMQNLSGLDPEVYEGKYRADIGYKTAGAPQTVLSYVTSENQYWYGQDTYVVYFPTMTDGSSFGASVQIAGMVGKNSENKEQAYEFLRLLMDMPMKTYSLPGQIFNTTFSPVNKENAYVLLESFENSTGSEMMGGQGKLTITSMGESYTIDHIKASEREREKLQHALENISFLYRVTDEGREADKILEFYKEESIQSYEESYLTILNMLNEKNQ